MVSLLLLVTVTVRVADGPVNTFDPREVLGAGIDGHERGQVLKMLRHDNVRAMLSAGLKPLSYRLRTELAGEAWHWNPEGRWSDPKHRQGYWVSNRRASKPIRLSYGYRLPRRGNTNDQANDDGYSRLDDGDTRTYWKSNPYLDRYYTGEDNSAHPAWVVIDFGGPRPIDWLRIEWGEPFATRFSVEYSDSEEMEVTDSGVWKPVAGGESLAGTGGDQTVHFAAPVTTRYVRLIMPEFSGTAPRDSTDVRDRLGVAIREIDGQFVQHSPDHHQTAMFVSSTDPWHRAADRDPNIEQPGFDLVYRLGLTNGLPMLMAVPVLYDVPENAAALVSYLKRVTHAELGEEPEEQYVLPEDYGALYLQWARAMHRVNPDLNIGGTSMVLPRADDEPKPTWLERMLDWFRQRREFGELAFFSFEWYPFDDVCNAPGPQRVEVPKLGRDLPLFMTEYGYSAYGAEAEVDLEGALINSEIVGQFLALGGKRAYLYGYEPNELINEKGCSWGNNMLFGLNESGGIAYRTATYWAARLLTQEWAQPSGGIHKMYRVDSDAPLVTPFAVERPDGRVSMMLINKDSQRPSPVALGQFAGTVDVFQYSREQYRWKADGDDGHPQRDLPPSHRVLQATAVVQLPPYSLTIVRGRLH